MNQAESVQPKPPEVLCTNVGALVRLTPRTSLVDEQVLAAFIESVDQCIQGRQHKLIVDLANVAAIGSAGLEALLDAQDKLLRKGGWLKYSQPSSLLTTIFHVCGISDYISCADTPADQRTEPPADGKTDAHKRLGDILIEQGKLTEEQVAEAASLQERSGMRIGRIVVDKSWVSEQDVIEALGVQLMIPVIRLAPGCFDPELSTILEQKVAKRLGIFPLFRVRGVLYVATATPQAVPSLDEVKERTGCSVKPVLAARASILEHVLGSSATDFHDSDLMADVDDDFELVDTYSPDDYSVIDNMAAGSPIINLVNSIIQRAVRDGASDIHIEPSRTRAMIRFRIDGILYEFRTIRMQLHPALVSRLKVMANLDIAERRMPQDGRIQVQTQGRSVDLRFSSLPGMYGEKIVLRILDKKQCDPGCRQAGHVAAQSRLLQAIC